MHTFKNTLSNNNRKKYWELKSGFNEGKEGGGRGFIAHIQLGPQINKGLIAHSPLHNPDPSNQITVPTKVLFP